MVVNVAKNEEHLSSLPCLKNTNLPYLVKITRLRSNEWKRGLSGPM